MNHISRAALAASLFALCLGPVQAETTALHLRIAPGQSVQDAIRMARLGISRAARPDPMLATRGKTINPTITAASIPNGTITVGVANSLPVLQFSYLAKQQGLNSVYFTFTSPNGENSLNYQYNPRTDLGSGTITFSPNMNAPAYAQPGKWTLTALTILDNAFNFTNYTQAQINALFPQPYLTVVNNGPVDITPPVVTAGAILTPTVSESSPVPEFEATLTGTDDVSGIDQAYVVITPPGGMFGQVDLVLAPFPTLNGTLTSYAPVFPGQPTGTWTISAYQLCDVVDNCLTDTNPADIQSLFGTTSFTVTP
jgi:hypothetical protein